MEAAVSLKTVVMIYQITCPHIPVDCHLCSPCYENPQISYIVMCSDSLSVVVLSRTDLLNSC
jgi:hypothetical protein